MAKSRSESAPRGARVKSAPDVVRGLSLVHDPEGSHYKVEAGMARALRGDSQRGREQCLARAEAKYEM